MDLSNQLKTILGTQRTLVDFVDVCKSEGSKTARIYVAEIINESSQLEKSYKGTIRMGENSLELYCISAKIEHDCPESHSGCVCQATTAMHNARIVQDYVERAGIQSVMIVEN